MSALAAIRADLPRWQGRIVELAAERPTATESEIGWAVVMEVSLAAAKLLLPIFDEHGGRNLDRDPPLDGMSPLTQADLVHKALGESAPPATLHARLAEHAARRRTR